MRAVLQRSFAALRAFASGFLGLAAPPPRDAAAARLHFEEKSRHRTHCC
ncbi:MAG: hypothetical protein H6Q91_2633 [Deltaproteobacteria bacterium]|nr:hypothetical protein [Deltaproteobacteria bacterium]